jgi:hypothetical protein
LFVESKSVVVVAKIGVGLLNNLDRVVALANRVMIAFVVVDAVFVVIIFDRSMILIVLFNVRYAAVYARCSFVRSNGKVNLSLAPSLA